MVVLAKPGRAFSSGLFIDLRRCDTEMQWEFSPSEIQDTEVREAFRLFGFVVIRNVLSRDEVLWVRSELDRAFSSPHLRDLPVMCPSELLKHEGVWANVFREEIVKSLKAALGPELCYQSPPDVQRNSYGLSGIRPYSGWHMDAGSESGNQYLRDPGYRFSKCGLFLQDFDNGWGGGIRVKPKSHRAFFEGNWLKRKYFMLRRIAVRAASMVRWDVDSLLVPTRAGDFCFFDSRLLHSSVPPSEENALRVGHGGTTHVSTYWEKIPTEHTKYVVYWDACNTGMSGDFINNSKRRAAEEAIGMTEKQLRTAVFTRILAMEFPDDFPEQFVAAASAHGIVVASLDTGGASFYKEKLKSMHLLHP